MKINEVAKLAGVSVRTLQYYDRIGLLKPTEVNEAKYRFYDEKSLEILQQILFFRELEFPLCEIKEIITAPGFERQEALKMHRELLLKKKERVSRLIELVDHTLKGEADMSFKEFDMQEIEETKTKYAGEVKERWGNTEAYKESEKRTAGYTKEDWKNMTDESNDIMKQFASIRDLSPESKEAQELVKRWQNYITEHFYPCTTEILQGLGLMYTEDERFTKNMDQFGEGTAEFMSRAIQVYCAKQNN